MLEFFYNLEYTGTIEKPTPALFCLSSVVANHFGFFKSNNIHLYHHNTEPPSCRLLQNE